MTILIDDILYPEFSYNTMFTDDFVVVVFFRSNLPNPVLGSAYTGGRLIRGSTYTRVYTVYCIKWPRISEIAYKKFKKYKGRLARLHFVNQYKKICLFKSLITVKIFWSVKLRCDERFTHAFTACSCVFKGITLVSSIQGNYFQNATACSKRTLKTTVATQLYICLVKLFRQVFSFDWYMRPMIKIVCTESGTFTAPEDWPYCVERNLLHF